MREEWERTALLIGEEAVRTLETARILLFGVGGVGGYVAEALARCGVGSFLLVDRDDVSRSNLNRQIIATQDTVGKPKAEVMKQRILSINPLAQVEVRKCFFLPENAHEFDFSRYSYVVDAVDTVTAKIEIVMQAKKAAIPVISCMGAGNKLDPSKFQIADIYKTSVCPLARVMRQKMKKRGIKDLKVLYSTEPPVVKKRIPASIAFVPSVAGLMIAGEVVKDLCKKA